MKQDSQILPRPSTLIEWMPTKRSSENLVCCIWLSDERIVKLESVISQMQDDRHLPARNQCVDAIFALGLALASYPDRQELIPAQNTVEDCVICAWLSPLASTRLEDTIRRMQRENPSTGRDQCLDAIFGLGLTEASRPPVATALAQWMVP